jgi:flagellar biosynthesis GTPase FlhF
VGKSEYRPHRFSVKDTALLLGISRSYLGTHRLARRTERGKPFYTASDIAILRAMGVGKRPRRLRPMGEVMCQAWMTKPMEERELERLRAMEERELERLRAIQEEARRQRARERSEEAARQKALKWREEAEQRTREWRASKKESPGAAETAEKKLEGSEPRSSTGSTQEATRRPWWRRIFGG